MKYLQAKFAMRLRSEAGTINKLGSVMHSCSANSIEVNDCNYYHTSPKYRSATIKYSSDICEVLGNAL